MDGMSATDISLELGCFERRVKPKIELEASASPETPSTQNKHLVSKLDESSSRIPVFKSLGMIDPVGVRLSLLSDESTATPPSSECFHDTPRVSCDAQSTLHAAQTDHSADVPVFIECPGSQAAVSCGLSTLCLPAVGSTSCSGGSGRCTTPHLPVKVRGMCTSCYQREYRKQKLSAVKPVEPQAKPVEPQAKHAKITEMKDLKPPVNCGAPRQYGFVMQLQSQQCAVQPKPSPVSLPSPVEHSHDVLRFHQERLKQIGRPLHGPSDHAATHRIQQSPIFPAKFPLPPPVTFQAGDIVRHKRTGYEVQVVEVNHDGLKIRCKQKSGFIGNLTEARFFELVRKRCETKPVAAASIGDPSLPLNSAELFPDSQAFDRYCCPITNLKYGEDVSDDFLCGCAHCCCFKDSLLSALEARSLTLPKEAVRSDKSVYVRNCHLVCLLVRFDQAADFALSDGRLVRDLMKNGLSRMNSTRQSLFVECGARSIALSGLDAGTLEMFDRLVADYVKKKSPEWKLEQEEREAEKHRLELIRKEDRLHEARSKIVVKQVTKTFNDYIPSDPPIQLDAHVKDSWQSAYSAQCFQLHKKPDFVFCQEVLDALMAANVNGLFTQVTQKLQQSIVRHVSIKECSSRHLLPAECSAPRQKRVTSEDLSRAAEVCLASFSRHVDLLEPFIERSVVAEMRATLPQEFVDDATDWPQPSTICGTMRPYQIKGLNWLICQHRNSIGSILADEMGLGKTIQTIAFIAHLLLTQERPAPHLIVVPLSVLSNWGNEFKKFCPCIRVKRIHVYSGNEAIKIFREIAHPSCPYDVIMTTYEVIRSDFWISKLVRINWHTLVLDEGHRVKNERTEAAHTCSLLRARFRLILTGTPIQNNMHESWALLNFLNPKVFTASVTFDKTFNLSSQNSNGLQTSQQLLDQCHKIMRLVFLRRLKSEVEMTLPPKLETRINCPLSEMQTFFTQKLLLRSSSIIKRMEEQRASTGQVSSDDMKKLQSLIMQLRKAANHPYLFDGAEDPELHGATSDEIISASGKMVWLDALLSQLLKNGHRVVIFSQFTRVLDIICDYLDMKQLRHSRLDGQTNRVIRQVLIDQFNRPDSKENIFVASTRAGGEGINLQTADTVILFDSDWNPQRDIQAMGRVHRIGQSRVVHVYRLVTSGSVEERILQRQQQKLYLDSCVIRGSTAIAQAIDDRENNESDDDCVEDEESAVKPSAVMEALKFGWNSVFTPGASGSSACSVSPRAVEALIDRSRGVSGASFVVDASGIECALLEEQQLSVATFNIEQPLVSTHLLNGEVLDSTADEDDVQAIAASWNQSRYASRVADAAPIYASKPMQNNWSHDDVCMACGDGGELLLCGLCPAVYHLECIGATQVPVGRWTCPHHFCCVCEKKSQDCSNCLFRCEVCPCAFCEDCKPDDMSFLPVNDCRFTKKGFKVPTNAYYIHCSDECRDAAKELK